MGSPTTPATPSARMGDENVRAPRGAAAPPAHDIREDAIQHQDEAEPRAPRSTTGQASTGDAAAVAQPSQHTPRRRGGRPKESEGHKLYRLERAVRQLGVDRILPPAIVEWRTELAEALGGPEHLSPQQVTLIDLAARDKLLLDSVDAWLLSQPGIVNRRARKCFPVVTERSRLADALQRRLEALGLARVKAVKLVSATSYAHGDEVEP